MEAINMEKVVFHELDQGTNEVKVFFGYPDATKEEIADFLQHYVADGEKVKKEVICKITFMLDIFLTENKVPIDHFLTVFCTNEKGEEHWVGLGWYDKVIGRHDNISSLIDALISKLPEEYILKQYDFKVSIGDGRYCKGVVSVMAANESGAVEMALNYLGNQLYNALPELDAEVSVYPVDHEEAEREKKYISDRQDKFFYQSLTGQM